MSKFARSSSQRGDFSKFGRQPSAKLRVERIIAQSQFGSAPTSEETCLPNEHLFNCETPVPSQTNELVGRHELDTIERFVVEQPVPEEPQRQRLSLCDVVSSLRKQAFLDRIRALKQASTWFSFLHIEEHAIQLRARGPLSPLRCPLQRDSLERSTPQAACQGIIVLYL